MKKFVNLTFELREYDEDGNEIVRSIRFDGHNAWQQLQAFQAGFTPMELIGFHNILDGMRQILGEQGNH